MYAIAAVIACAGIGLAVWTLIPEKRPEPRGPGILGARSSAGSPSGNSRTPGGLDPGNLPPGAQVVRSTASGSPTADGRFPFEVAELKNPPDHKPVKADDSWPSLMDQLASAIEVAAKDVPNLSDTPTKTAHDLGQAGARALLCALTTDNTRSLEAIKDLGGDTNLMLPSGPPMGPVAGAFADGQIDLANITVRKAPQIERRRSPMPPPEDGAPRRRAMMISMMKNTTEAGEVSVMTVDEGGLFPNVADFTKDKLPAWDIHVPIKVAINGVEPAKPTIVSVIMAKDPKSGQWSPASWNYIVSDPQAASSIMKGMMSQVGKMRAAEAAAAKEKK